MTDVVVTVPKSFDAGNGAARGLASWVAEGDAAGAPWSGESWSFDLGARRPPKIAEGERVYIVCEGKLRGYAPLYSIETGSSRWPRLSYYLVRHGGAVAVTIDEDIRGFRGFRYRWWDRAAERPFPSWRTP